MKQFFILMILSAFLLTGCTTVLPEQTGQSSLATTEETATETVLPAGWFTEDQQTFYITEGGSRYTGWLELEGKRYYLDENGVLQTGWLDLNDTRYYLDSSGVLQTGWLESYGQIYYLKDDGSIARGKTEIGEDTYYFAADGHQVLLVNPWNYLPDGYEPNLVTTENGHQVDSSCKDALEQMLTDCRKAGFDVRIVSSYRTQTTQVELYRNKVSYYLNKGYEDAAARAKAATFVAIPGTSEHQLGLALDLVDNGYWGLDEKQENTPSQKWLMEHCWEYGFILRYPNGKKEITGIVYEPWHYRYVGKELAQDLKTSGLCLEEYFSELY